MSEIVVNQLLHRAHLFITEGQEEEALATLDQIQTEEADQKYEVAYLRAWSYTLTGRWDEAAQFLLNPAITPESTNGHLSDIQAFGQTERRRRAFYLLLLGKIATKLARYEEATRHYTQCIKFLDERRMNVVSVRIQARCGLGAAYIQTGFYSEALTHFEDALRLCGDNTEHLELPGICHGLCEAHRRLGNFEIALEYGEKALQLYASRGDKSMEGDVRNLLGRVSFQMHNFQATSHYYTEALTLAISVNKPTLITTSLTALAELRLAEDLLDEARRYCQQALEYRECVPDSQLLATMYIVSGKVAEAQARKGQQTTKLLDEAITWYKEAETTLLPLQAKVELAEVYRLLAQILENSGQQDRAISYWKSAFSLYQTSD
jgi:tetratricopeptide (TPR) repeat protein